jgi:hypothetical protein
MDIASLPADCRVCASLERSKFTGSVTAHRLFPNGVITYIPSNRPLQLESSATKFAHRRSNQIIRTCKTMANRGDNIEVDPEMVCWRNRPCDI